MSNDFPLDVTFLPYDTKIGDKGLLSLDQTCELTEENELQNLWGYNGLRNNRKSEITPVVVNCHGFVKIMYRSLIVLNYHKSVYEETLG